MANQGHGITYNAGELTGQAQARKDDFLNQCEEGCQSSTQDSSSTAQASSFLQQTGEQVKSMAHGAAEAVKNTLGMNTENIPTKNTCNDPSHPSTRA
ncbi:late embryogenesis abundant protein [Salix suchowensis]|nr:late embryogenesis abundant protein [Salix suchowensis]